MMMVSSVPSFGDDAQHIAMLPLLSDASASQYALRATFWGCFRLWSSHAGFQFNVIQQHGVHKNSKGNRLQNSSSARPFLILNFPSSKNKLLAKSDLIKFSIQNLSKVLPSTRKYLLKPRHISDATPSYTFSGQPTLSDNQHNVLQTHHY